MSFPKWIPRWASWASAFALFLFSWAVSFAMAVVLPLLFELMPHSPRLAWLGVLLVWIAPMAVAGAGHRAMHGALDRADIGGVTRGKVSGLTSLWLGFVAWAAIIVVSSTTGLIMLVLDPPPVDPDAREAIEHLLVGVTSVGAGTLRCIVWIVLAAYVWELERAVQRSEDMRA